MKHCADYDALLKICKSRRSTRTFDSRPVPEEMIERIKKIAHTSPYASGRKKWDMLVVADREALVAMRLAVDRRTGEIQNKIRSDMKRSFDAYARNFSFFATAPAVIALVFRAAPSLSLMLPEPDGEILQWERDNYVKSISCVAMLVLLAAESLGLAGCYVTGALIAESEIGRLIKIPQGWSIGALIPIGYKAGGNNDD